MPSSDAQRGFVWDDGDAPRPPPRAPAPTPPLAPPPVPTTAGELLFDRYASPVQIGRGGAGTVYRAVDVRTGRTVAVKRIREDSGFPIERVRREVDAVRRIDHPGVVAILEVVERPGEVALVLEYVPGGDLERHVRENGPLPLEQGLELGLALARTLEHAHARHVVHRDLKPANVLLASPTEPRLTDFGLAQTISVSSFTTEAQALGTYDYMAPEQRRDARLADARSDVFAFGKTLYRALTGGAPHTVRESLIPLAVRDAILRCLEDDPARRFPSMGAVADALAAARASLARPAVPRLELVALDRDERPVARFPLREGENLVGVLAEGSRPDVDLGPIDAHEIVSRRHALLELRAGRVTLHHLSRTNPTHLNGRLVREGAPQEVREGDRIVLSTRVSLELRGAT